MRPEAIQTSLATLADVEHYSTATPTTAVQHAMNSTRRILDQSLDDTLRLSQQHLIQWNPQDDDEASIDQELNELATWQDCIQTELLQLDVSWSQEQQQGDGSQSTWSEEYSDVEKHMQVAMNMEEDGSVRGSFPTSLLELIRHLAFQATGPTQLGLDPLQD